MQSTTVLDRVQVPVGAVVEEPRSLYAALQRVHDPRGQRGRRYEAALVLVLLLLAKLAGENTVSGVADWVRWRLPWLRQALPLPRPTLPCANTYVNVCAHIDPAELNTALAAYFATLATEQDTETAQERAPDPAPDPAPAEWEHLVLDGKELCGSHRDTRYTQTGTQVVSVYNVTRQFVLRQVPVAGPGREQQTALLTDLDLRGCVISADALHTHPPWCRQVLAQQGAYLLFVKANQPTLYQDIALLFSQPPVPWLPEQHAQQVAAGHGRLTCRSLRTSAELNAYLHPTWPAVAQVFQLQRTTRRGRRTTTETVYGLTSLSPEQAPPQLLLQWTRQHWHIENRLHWRRDVTLGEDACTVCTAQAPQVLALLNSALLALLDHLGIPNVAAQRRYFDAFPQHALALLLHPP